MNTQMVTPAPVSPNTVLLATWLGTYTILAMEGGLPLQYQPPPPVLWIKWAKPSHPFPEILICQCTTSAAPRPKQALNKHSMTPHSHQTFIPPLINATLLHCTLKLANFKRGRREMFSGQHSSLKIMECVSFCDHLRLETATNFNVYADIGIPLPNISLHCIQ